MDHRFLSALQLCRTQTGSVVCDLHSLYASICLQNPNSLPLRQEFHTPVMVCTFSILGPKMCDNYKCLSLNSKCALSGKHRCVWWCVRSPLNCLCFPCAVISTFTEYSLQRNIFLIDSVNTSAGVFVKKYIMFLVQGHISLSYLRKSKQQLKFI